MIGKTIGPYHVIDKLGEGGMGEVYRARDTKLNRDVAIKILPDAFASDAERVARFTREAQTLATLNHPHIAQIHGLEESSGVRALVMELVEGEDLAQRIARGALPLEDALAIARQVADALEAAHDKGIIHRDLKPANIQLTPDGMVKVLDFGLAKSVDPSAAAASATMSPTLSLHATQAGVILGTAAYMAPEQARGKAVDKRADIWAFGCVLYEMLTGRRAFAGEEISDTLAYVLTKEIDWSVLTADTPPHVRRLLRRCLEKDPKRRLRDIGEARVELEDVASGEEPMAATAAPAAAPRRSISRRSLPWIAGAAAGGALTALVAWTIVRPAPTALRPSPRLSVALPSTIELVGGRPAISPDGTRLVFAAVEGGRRQLYIRGLDELQAQPIRGTDGANNPFFSPDGESVAFFTGPAREGMLKKVPVGGGQALTITDAIGVNSGVWTGNGTIIFTRGGALYTVPSVGGTATQLTTPVPGKERFHSFPDVLPDGRHVLFSVAPPPDFDQSQVAVLSLDTGQYRTVIERGYNARFVASGHIVYALAGNLMAVPFDVARLETTGPAVPIVEGVRSRLGTGEADFAVTSAGWIAYAPGTLDRQVQRTLVWVDRAGNEEPLPVPARHYTYARLSPDARRIALDLRDGDQDIWLWDIERRTLTRLTVDPNPDGASVWMPDGKRIVFARQAGARASLYLQAADGSGEPERLIDGAAGLIPTAVTPDGTRLLLETRPNSAGELFVLSLAGDRRATPLIQTRFSLANPVISPDGRWVAHLSNESGLGNEVYVRPFPKADSARFQVSAGGGTDPLWSRDGRELFFTVAAGNTTRVMAAAVAGSGEFSAAAPRQLFEGPYFAGRTAVGLTRPYDVSPDDKRLLMIKDLAPQSTASSDAPLVVMLNFFDELKRLAPVKP